MLEMLGFEPPLSFKIWPSELCHCPWRCRCWCRWPERRCPSPVNPPPPLLPPPALHGRILFMISAFRLFIWPDLAINGRTKSPFKLTIWTDPALNGRTSTKSALAFPAHHLTGSGPFVDVFVHYRHSSSTFARIRLSIWPDPDFQIGSNFSHGFGSYPKFSIFDEKYMSFLKQSF